MQVQDFNPGIAPNGVFWIVKVPNDAVKIPDDTLTIHVENIAVVDQGFFAGGTGTAPAKVSFDIAYTKEKGTQRIVRPSSGDPLSPFNWAGKMWMATNSGTFSVSYNDMSFSATGSFSSSGTFGEMGFERKGSFVEHDELKEAAAAALHPVEETHTGGAALAGEQTSSVRPRLFRTSFLLSRQRH